MIDQQQMRTYQRLREAGRELCGEILKVIPKDVLIATASELGLWKNGILVAEEGETDIMADRLIFDKRWNGKSTLQHFEERTPAAGLPDAARRFIAAMARGRFSLFAIWETQPGNHAVLWDRLAERRTGQPQPLLKLLDVGISKTGLPGMLLATRILDAGEFSMTSGVSFPFAPEAEGDILAYLREKELGYRKRRQDLRENYSLYFFRLHRRFGVAVRYGSAEAE
jgi:hypothetical protein